MTKLILAVLIAALRTMQLVYARSGTTGQKLSDAMDADRRTAGRSPQRKAVSDRVYSSARQSRESVNLMGVGGHKGGGDPLRRIKSTDAID